MIDVEALRVLYVDTKDVDENIFNAAISNINCKKEELEYISYDFFDNFAVGIITNKQLVVSYRSEEKNIITKKIDIKSIGMVGVKNIDCKNRIIVGNKVNGSLIIVPSNTDKYMFEVAIHLYEKSKPTIKEFYINKYINKKDKAAI